MIVSCAAVERQLDPMRAPRIAALLGAIVFLAASPAARPAPAPPAPRLVVLIVIDQFRADFLERFRDRFGPGGFNRLRREGAEFADCFYPYALTETAPGHATLATGTTPDRHGIVSNDWFDPRLGRSVASVEDAAFPPVGGSSDLPGESPKNLVGSTLSDELRLATGGGAKVYGIAVKDRAAILSVGHAASGAFWYDDKSGRFMSSRYYGAELPDWVAAFNARGPADRFFGSDWLVQGRTAVALRGSAGHPDAGFYARLPSTPFIHDMIFDFARRVVEREDLGRDAIPDYLFIGLSGHDYLGHEVGPYSPAVEEMARRTDAQIADFLRFLDERVGPGRYWVALSADHGVAPTLPQASLERLPAARLDEKRLREAMLAALEARFGPGPWFLKPLTWTRLWLDPETLKARGAGLAEAARVAGLAALQVDGVRGYFTAADSNLDAATLESCRRSAFAGRSPDLLLLVSPFILFDAEAAANHGTPYSYDTHVPLLLFGPPFRPGVYHGRVSPADLAPTLAAALHLTPPALASGRVLTEALRAEGRER